MNSYPNLPPLTQKQSQVSLRQEFVVPKPSQYSQIKKKVLSLLDRELKKINKNNVIYYFAGFTTFVVFVIFVTPVLWGILTKRKIEPVKASTTITTTKKIANTNATAFKQIELAKEDVETLKTTTLEETIKAFQDTLVKNDINLIKGYIVEAPTIFITQADCCGVTTRTFVKTTMSSINPEKKPWNFDQGLQNYPQIKAKDGQFNDNYFGLSESGSIVGIKLDKDNHIINVNVIYDYQAYLDSFQADTESLSD
jgi:hypothetical protein